MKVYILSTYQEDGAEDVQATLDKSKITQLLKNLSVKYDGPMDFEEEKLKVVLENDQSNQLGHKLSDGWGGVMLHIIELE